MRMMRQQEVINPFQSNFREEKPRVSFNLYQHNPKQSLSLNQSLLLKSQQLSKKYKYLKYDIQGNTQLIDQPKLIQSGFSYTKVHIQQKQNFILGENINWTKDIKLLNLTLNIKQNVVLRSLKKLYQPNYRPNFLQWLDQTKSVAFKYYSLQIPQCLYELDHLSPNHTRFLFVNKSYSQNGLYQVIVNQDGRFRLITVNDLVPVQKQSNQHIWGIQQPWKMILLKVWACLNQGYTNILRHYHPFHFLEHFTSNNWKYYNLQRQGAKWINKFKDILDVCYIVLQTKQSQKVTQMGLIPGSVAYNIVQITNDRDRGVQIQIKSRFKHKWKGKLNLINYNKKFIKKDDKQFRLQKNFILTKDEFFQMFCCSYIISLSKSSTHITDYVQINIPRNSKKAIYLKFKIQKQGFMDFSFIQSYRNKIPVQNQQTRIDIQRYKKQTGKIQESSRSRYLRCKYMLIRCLRNENKPFESKLSKSSVLKQSKLTSQTKYEAYEVQNLRGYNKGQGHFLMLQAGQYYMRLKSQFISKDAVYYLNYCCSEKISILQQIILGEQRQEILQNCILSLLPSSYQYRTRLCNIYTGNKFDEMGYGYIVIQNKSKKQKNTRKVLFEINLLQLQNQGYKLKGDKFKLSNLSIPIVIEVKYSNHLVLIFKKIQDNLQRKYVWPPKSIGIFKAQDLQEQK